MLQSITRYFSVHLSLLHSVNPSYLTKSIAKTSFLVTCTRVYKSLYRSVGPSFRPSVCPYICISVRPSICPSVHLSVRPSIYPSLPPSVRPSLHPSFQLKFLPKSYLNRINAPAHPHATDTAVYTSLFTIFTYCCISTAFAALIVRQFLYTLAKVEALVISLLE